MHRALTESWQQLNVDRHHAPCRRLSAIMTPYDDHLETVQPLLEPASTSPQVGRRHQDAAEAVDPVDDNQRVNGRSSLPVDDPPPGVRTEQRSAAPRDPDVVAGENDNLFCALC